ncbi:Uncharacterised protein [Chromobacterium violaceum]|uniref:Uncharacterized protein n=1 Tax=Chromobacterium violaceum TaxID=536 RepID=A0A3S4LFF2_CHRVL|nr:Uncharacterised protein [Chromobacterium violaceum]
MSSQFHGLAIGNGNSNYLQVLGLANITDTAYLTDWQDSGGNWHAGFALPVPSDYPKGHFFQLTTGVGNSNYLQVLALERMAIPIWCRGRMAAASGTAACRFPNRAATAAVPW